MDTGAAAGIENSAETLLAQRVLSMCKEYLHHPGVVRDMAALLLGRLLTRPDMKNALGDFLTWSGEALKIAQGVRAPFLVPGQQHDRWPFIYSIHRMVAHACLKVAKFSYLVRYQHLACGLRHSVTPKQLAAINTG